MEPSTISNKSSQIDLTDEIRRHVVVGIALNNHLVPQVKEFVDQQMKVYHKMLVKDYRIDTSQSLLDKKVIRREKLGLNIFDRGNSLSNIRSHDVLAKHYQQQHMTETFISILNEGTDASTIITILERSCVFGKDINELSKQIRAEIRNKWAHCNYKEWTDEKFLQCFKIMIVLVENIFPEGSALKDKLEEWKENGIKLLKKEVDNELVQKFFEEVSVMNGRVARWENLNKKEFKSLISRIEKISLDIKGISENMKDVKEEQSEMKGTLKNHGKRLKDLETKNDEIDPLKKAFQRKVTNKDIAKIFAQYKEWVKSEKNHSQISKKWEQLVINGKCYYIERTLRKNGKKFSAEDLLNRIPLSQTSLVTGPAGSGKSTLAASITLDWARTTKSRFDLVLFLSSLYKTDKLPLHKQLWEEYAGHIREQESLKIYEKLLEMRDKILIIIDGIGKSR